MPAPAVILVTGASAAGKSTIAQALAERLPKAVHLRGDAFRKMIVTGRAAADADPLPEAFVAQLELRYAIACDAVERYAAAGFQVVYQDVILGGYLQLIASRLHPLGLAVIVLDAGPEAIAAREAARGKTAYRGDWTPEGMVRGLRETTPRLGLWLDSSNLSVADTVEAIMARLDEALV